jgi:hypothetical protein
MKAAKVQQAQADSKRKTDTKAHGDRTPHMTSQSAAEQTGVRQRKLGTDRVVCPVMAMLHNKWRISAGRRRAVYAGGAYRGMRLER